MEIPAYCMFAWNSPFSDSNVFILTEKRNSARLFLKQDGVTPLLFDKRSVP